MVCGKQVLLTPGTCCFTRKYGKSVTEIHAEIMEKPGLARRQQVRIDECKKRVMQYEKMLLFSIKYDLENPFDVEGMQNAMFSFKGSVDIFDEKLKVFLLDYLLLSNEGCKSCQNKVQQWRKYSNLFRWGVFRKTGLRV